METVEDFTTLEISIKPPRGRPSLAYGRTRINGNFNPGDGLAMSRIAQKERAYIYEFARFLRTHVPSFEESDLHVVAPLTCARGGKSLESVYIVTAEDVARSARFDDVICIYYDDKKYYPGGCDIPYRMLLPVKVDGLLAADKSAVKRGPQIRQRYCVQLMGQAARVAASLAVKNRVEPRHLEVRELQKTLHYLGSEMGMETRLRKLGII